MPEEKSAPATVWLKISSDESATSAATLILRADGTYTKKLDASAQGAFGGTHHGRWTRNGDLVHLSGDGNWPPYDENLSLFRRADSPREAPTISGGFQAASFADDMLKANSMLMLDRRYIATLQELEPGRASDAVVTELAAIQGGYKGLLQSGAPAYPLYKLDDIRRKIAETEDSIARAHDSMNHWDVAVRHYEAAAGMFESIGASEKAQRSRACIGRLRLTAEGRIDAEFKRLISLLEKTLEGTLDHADVLVELGELYGKTADDYESERTLQAALRELKLLGSDPSGIAIANALNETVRSISGGTAIAGATPIEQTLKLRSLYCRSYLALAQIYKESDPQKAAEYLEMAEDHDGQKLNSEFAEEVLRTLYGNSRKPTNG
jgi:hypothetical protein